LGGFLLIGEVEDTSEKLICYIHDNPGCHLRRIKRASGKGMGNVQYHLDKLEKLGRITSTKRGFYKYYFPAGIFQEDEKEILEVLSHETARKILMFIIEQKSPTQTDVVNSIKISARSISWHVGHLIDLDIIWEIKDGKYKRYLMHESKQKYMINLLKNYYPNIWDKWSMRVVEMFLSLSIGED